MQSKAQHREAKQCNAKQCLQKMLLKVNVNNQTYLIGVAPGSFSNQVCLGGPCRFLFIDATEAPYGTTEKQEMITRTMSVSEWSQFLQAWRGFLASCPSMKSSGWGHAGIILYLAKSLKNKNIKSLL